MHQQRIPVIILLLLFHLVAFSQETIVRGSVMDLDNGNKLAYATILFSNSTTGTTTDENGRFEITTRNLDLSEITVSYVGYESQEKSIQPGTVNQLVLQLAEIKLELEVVEVRGKRRAPKDTAAIELYRNVVRNKYRNDPSQYETYQYQQYSKTEFGLYNISDKMQESKLAQKFDYVFESMEVAEDGTRILPFLMKESSNQYYYRKDPEKTKKILLGDRFSGMDNSSVSDMIEYNFEPIEIYSNLIRINGKPMLSPFANNALMSYKYFLTDTADIEGLTCYKLEFTGRGNADAAFTGHAWIHDSTFALQSIRLSILANSSINFISDFIVQQDFELVNGKYWFKNYEFMQSQYNLFNKSDKERQSFLVRKTDQRKDLKINVPIDNKLFEGEEEIIMPGARDQGTTFWDTARTEALSDREENIFQAVDSFKSSTFYKSIRWFTYALTTGYMDATYVEFGKIFQAYSWNAVEGGRVRMGMRTREDLSERIQFAPYFAYGLKDEVWKYGLQVRIHLKRTNENWHMLGLKHTYDMSQLRDDNPILRPDPQTYDYLSLSLMRTDPLKELFLLRHSTLWYEKEWKKGLTTRLSFEHKIFYSVPNGEVFSQYDANTNVSTPIDQFKTSVVTLSIVHAKELKFIEEGFRRSPMASVKPIFSFDMKIGIKGLLGGDYNYNSLHFGVRQKLLGPIGYTHYTADMGLVLGYAPYPILTNHPGNESFMYSRWTYQLLKEGEFISDKYAQLWVIHHFDGKIFDKIPGISKLQFRSLVAFRVLVGHLDDQNKQLLELPVETTGLNSVYAEVGVGIENILKILRVDAYFRLTQRDKPDINKWGLRFYLSPNF
ncbi:MAG: carboxypeptidase-like regulatory domain-containing protein [Bacteroidetes bacterium]|nr:carboxypeptidase-like regulatory domain-containing protein [Bacteroidota bacterium]